MAYPATDQSQSKPLCISKTTYTYPP